VFLLFVLMFICSIIILSTAHQLPQHMQFPIYIFGGAVFTITAITLISALL